MKTLIYRIFIFLSVFILSVQLSAQINITLRVLPPYQSRITEYASKPNLVLLQLTNVSTTVQQVQLTGSITGDNGIKVRVRNSYKSPRPISINPGQSMSFNGNDIAYLFDPSAVDVFGLPEKGIVRDARLPEGNYEICIRALDYNTRNPLSAEAPLGCTRFYVNDLETPVITSPYNGQALLDNIPGQNFPITWTTPPGAPPNTQYLVKMVEIIANRNPNDAMATATTPAFFEKVVPGMNSLLYGPADPALTPGRKYALMVQAKDPLGIAAFRNNGKSEVYYFTYGKTDSATAFSGGLNKDEKPTLGKRTVDYSTNTIKGRLVWAFKSSEEQFGQEKKSGSMPLYQEVSKPATDLTDYYLGQNTVQKNSAASLALTDPTLFNGVNNNKNNSNKNQAYPSQPASVNSSSSAATSTAFSYEQASTTAGKNTYPLKGVTVIIKDKEDKNARSQEPSKSQTKPNTGAQANAPTNGLRTGASVNAMINGTNNNAPSPSISAEQGGLQLSQAAQQLNVVATGTTDENGNFTLELLNPQYDANQHKKGLIVSVTTEGFEPFEYEIDANTLGRQETIDLGQQVLTAKTYRLSPKINLEKLDGVAYPVTGMRVNIYRSSSQIAKYPFLEKEGQRLNGNVIKKMVNGVQYELVATDSIRAGENVVTSFDYSWARIFYSGSLYMEVEDMAGYFSKLTTDLRTKDPKAAPVYVLNLKPEYEVKFANAGVSGQVYAAAGENKIGIAGAILTINFSNEDLVKENQNTVTTGNNSVNKNMSAAVNAGGGFNINTNNSSEVSPNMVAAALQKNGNAMAVEINAVNSGGKNSVYQGKTVDDGLLDESALQKKYGQYTVRTDSTGHFYIGNLPTLKAGAMYNILLLNLPYNYRNLPVNPGEMQSFATTRGVEQVINYEITTKVINAVGRVVAENKKPVGAARIHVKGSSHYFETGETGIFQTTLIAGKNTLVVEKGGYAPYETTITIIEPKGAGDLIDAASNIGINNVGGWEKSVAGTPTVQNALASGEKFSPNLFGFAVNQGGNNGNANNPFQSQVNNSYQNNEIISSNGTADLGDIGPMMPRISKINFIVLKAGSNAPVNGAKITVFDASGSTNTNGNWYYSGPGGPGVVTVAPPIGSGLVAQQKSLNISENGNVVDVKIILETGIRVSGFVKSAGQPVGKAVVSAEGFNYMNTESTAEGYYEIYLPQGTQLLRAAKTGFISKTEEKVIQKGLDNAVNFNLQSGNGKNYSTLLGFDIELDKAVPEGNAERWTGRFVNIKPLIKSFKSETDIFKFSDIKVTFDNAGNAIPEKNEVLTNVTEIPMKAFGFLPLILKNASSPIKIVKDSEGKGSIKGQLQLDFTRVISSKLKFPFSNIVYAAVKKEEGKAVTPDALSIEMFRAGNSGALPDVTLQLATKNNEIVSLDLYGFKLNLNLSKSSVGTTGLLLSGNVITPALGPVSSAKIDVETLQLTDKFEISKIKISESGLPELKIADWKAKLKSLIFNEEGFKLGGSLTFTLPNSNPSQIDFTNFKLSVQSLFGGKFSIPAEGVNVFNLATFKTAGKELSFGKVGNTQTYYLSGSANIKFQKMINSEISIPSFQVQTDGKFMLESPVNYSASLSFASFDISGITVNSLQGTDPFILIKGKFALDVPFIKIESGDIKFSVNSNKQVAVNISKLSGELSVAVMKVALSIDAKENGLEADGKLSIPNTPINAQVNFHYYKINGGLDIGAGFKTGFPITLGAMQITDVGGGFSYNSATKYFKININGAISISGMDAAVSLKPVDLTVESGPVITGFVGIKVGSSFAVGNAKMILDAPGKFFSINIAADMEPIKDVATAKVAGLLKISWNPDKKYLFLGSLIDVNMLKIIKANGEFALGINIKDPKNADGDIKDYFRKLDDNISSPGYVFSGTYLHAESSFGVPKKDAKELDVPIFWAKAWYHSATSAELFLNFATNDYKMGLGGSIDAGAEAGIGPLSVGANFAACYKFYGAYNTTDGWKIGGKAAGEFAAHMGCEVNDCNDYKTFLLIPCGFRICIGAHASLDISSKKGISTDVGLGKSADGNFCN